MINHVGVYGLSPMGLNLTLNILDTHKVSVYNRTSSKTDSLKAMITKNKENIIFCYSISDFINSLPNPKVIFLIIKSDAVKITLEKILPLLSIDDIICDFGNTCPDETEKHVKIIENHFLSQNDKKRPNNSNDEDKLDYSDSNVNFLGIGISGGTKGARKNGCLMISGSEKSFQMLENIFEKLTNSFKFLGSNFLTGHFVKFIHNGIEYSIMMLISELNEILNEYEKNYEENEFNKNNSLISKTLMSVNDDLNIFLLDALFKVLQNHEFPKIGNYLEMKGTSQWILKNFIGDFKLKLMSNAVNQRIQSNQKKFFGKTVKKINELELLKKSDLKNLIIFLLKECYFEGFQLCEKNEFTKKYLNEDVIIKVIKLWKNGCIISGKILDLIEKDINKNDEKSFDFNFKNLKKILLFALENNIPCSQLSSIFNKYLDDSKERRMIAGMRDFFGDHKVRINGDWKNLKW